ncbi:transcription factor of the MADS box [Tilletia horrida]|uniref:Transcription factor of the MADS box n=1 Tax=Tilletia horrida TaxID=155126 RepID=A0AAN6JVE1_9BASI|nr:transcription factor of the MADS box [Tilletia horrida]KAK0554689.1 transcription factor of the MADS box [Tilletia horrida]KAK0569807.1 transcription factor of the MADS box [Tilletia horrida]
MSGHMASYGNMVTQLVPPRRPGNRQDHPDNEMAGAKGEADAVTGRRRIQIGYITNETRRASTFKKRKAGILKKAYELAELTGSHVLVVAVNDQGKCYSFATPSLQPMVTHPEGQMLLKRCLANGQGSNESTAFSSDQVPDDAAFGVVESIPDDEDDDDIDEDSDSDSGDASPNKKKAVRKGPAKGHLRTTSATNLGGQNKSAPGPLSQQPIPPFHLSGMPTALRPVFLSSSQPASMPMACWSNGSSDGALVGGSLMASAPPSNLINPDLMTLDQSGAPLHMNGHLGSLPSPFIATQNPALSAPGDGMPQQQPTSSAAPFMNSFSNAPVRVGRQRAATMLNPIELHPLPSDKHLMSGAALPPSGPEGPSSINALALNLGSAYIGANQDSDLAAGSLPNALGLQDGHGLSTTYDVQISGLGRPRSMTTFARGGHEGTQWDGAHKPAHATGPINGDVNFATLPSSSTDRPTSSGTLGKRKVSFEMDTAADGSAPMSQSTSNPSSSSVLGLGMPLDEGGPRKVAKFGESSSPSKGSPPIQMTAFDPVQANLASPSTLELPKSFGRVRSHTFDNSVHVGPGFNHSDFGLGAPSSFAPSFISTPGGVNQSLHNGEAFPFLNMDAFQTTAGLGLVNPDSTAPRTMMDPALFQSATLMNPSSFSGLLPDASAMTSPSVETMHLLGSLSFGDQNARQMPLTHMASSISAPAGPNNSSSPLASSAGGPNFLAQLQQQYQEHHVAQLQQRQELARLLSASGSGMSLSTSSSNTPPS